MTTKTEEKKDKESVEEREREGRETKKESPQAFYRISNTISIWTPSCATFTKNVAEDNVSRTWRARRRERERE